MPIQLEFLTKYWSQITVILGAIGFLIKIPFDYRIKRQELAFGHLMSQQSDAIKAFFVAYEAFQITIHDLLFDYKNGVQLSNADVKSRVSTSYRDLLAAGDYLRFYLTKEEYSTFSKPVNLVLKLSGEINTEIAVASVTKRTSKERQEFAENSTKVISDARKFIAIAADEYRQRFF